MGHDDNWGTRLTHRARRSDELREVCPPIGLFCTLCGWASCEIADGTPRPPGFLPPNDSGVADRGGAVARARGKRLGICKTPVGSEALRTIPALVRQRRIILSHECAENGRGYAKPLLGGKLFKPAAHSCDEMAARPSHERQSSPSTRVPRTRRYREGHGPAPAGSREAPPRGRLSPRSGQACRSAPSLPAPARVRDGSAAPRTHAKCRRAPNCHRSRL